MHPLSILMLKKKPNYKCYLIAAQFHWKNINPLTFFYLAKLQCVFFRLLFDKLTHLYLVPL